MTKATSYYPVTSFPKWRSDVVPSLRLKPIIREKKKKKKNATHKSIRPRGTQTKQTQREPTVKFRTFEIAAKHQRLSKTLPKPLFGCRPVELGLNPEPLSNFQSCMSFFYLEFLSVSLETNSFGGLFFIFIFCVFSFTLLLKP